MIGIAIKHFILNIIRLYHRTCVLTDSKLCELAYEKLCHGGEFSASPCISMFLSNMLVTNYPIHTYPEKQTFHQILQSETHQNMSISCVRFARSWRELKSLWFDMPTCRTFFQIFLDFLSLAVLLSYAVGMFRFVLHTCTPSPGKASVNENCKHKSAT